MAYVADDKNLAHIAKLLPKEAMDAWCETATQAADMGLDHNACVIAAWNEVGKTWQRPPTGKKWIAKDSPDAGSVHVDAPLGSDGKRKKKPGTASYADCMGDMTVKAEASAKIVKVGDDESRMAYGWASVISEKGEPVVDTQDDVISADELEKATTEFMADARVAKAMHDGEGIGEVLHSFPLTAELAKSLGISADKEGWIVGVKVHDDATWARVKANELGSFSIGGQAVREPIE